VGVPSKWRGPPQLQQPMQTGTVPKRGTQKEIDETIMNNNNIISMICKFFLLSLHRIKIEQWQ